MEKILYKYLLKIGDDSLIMGQRLSEWCGKGPYLEEDLALVNVALDYIGQANYWYGYASQVEGSGKTEDDIAFLRYEKEYLNSLLVELPNGDYAQTIVKILLFSNYQQLLYRHLQKSSDSNIVAIATKAIKEVNYHVEHAQTWFNIFAGGTEESKLRLLQSFEYVWRYTKDMFAPIEGEEVLVKAGIVPDGKLLYQSFGIQIKAALYNTGVVIEENAHMYKGSRQGEHTEHFGHLLAPMQYMQRVYPNCTW